MPFSDQYLRQVTLLVRVLPFIAREECFALKGGTAINLFVRNMPRLSVDIDLTYVPVEGRPESLAKIDAALKRIAEDAQTGSPVQDVVETAPNKEGAVTKLLARDEAVQISIEVTPVLRGCVFEPEVRAVSSSVEENFGFAEIQVVSFADLYAGKIVAALDRQHPRDLFDMRDLLANEGVDDDLRRAFIVYLLSHDRPMHEVLTARRKNISQEFERSFDGMTDDRIELDELVAAREATIKAVIEKMPDDHRKFLVSFERGEPEWPLLGVEHAADLPAVKWRQLNLDKLSAKARTQLVSALAQVLGMPTGLDA